MKQAAEILIENSRGEILMLLRDDKPTIPFPNMWDIPGGGVEPNETPGAAVIREIREELELRLARIDVKLLKAYSWPEQIEYIYHTYLNLNPEKVNLHEGQRVQYFSRQQLLEMKLAFHDSEIMKDLFGK